MSISRPGQLTAEKAAGFHCLGECVRPKVEFGRFGDEQNILSCQDLNSGSLVFTPVL